MIRYKLDVEAEADDTTNIAGWVFADLLLSLSIIFLASISFIVPTSNALSVTSANQNLPTLVENLGEGTTRAPFSQGANFYYSDFDEKLIEQDIRTYLQNNSLSLRSEVIYAQIVGGYDATQEGSEVGTLRALEVSIAIKNADLAAFTQTNFDLTTSDKLKSKEIALRLTFAPPIENR